MENKYSFKRIIKLAFISWVVLFAILTSIGLLFPGDINVSRTVNINAPKDSVMQYCNNLMLWKKWIEAADSANFSILSPSATGVGAKIRMGTYQVSITSSTPDSVNVYWQGDHSNPMQSYMYLFTDTLKHQTVVNWNFKQHIPWYPWERLSSMMTDKIISTPMELSLNNLKEIAEENNNKQ